MVDRALTPFKVDFMGKLLDIQQQMESLRTEIHMNRRSLKKVGDCSYPFVFAGGKYTYGINYKVCNVLPSMQS